MPDIGHRNLKPTKNKMVEQGTNCVSCFILCQSKLV